MKSIYKQLSKKVLLATLIAHLSVLSFATTYYVSNSGNDSNSGLATSAPWKSLAKVNAFAFKAGDQILFERGSSFYGTLAVNYSGAAGSPIVYGAYGTGANPVISGFTQVTAWTNLGSNIWESTNVVSNLSSCNMVVIDNVNTPMGRTPNSGYYYFQSHSGNTSVTSSDLSGTPNWTGAEVAFNTGAWTTRRALISNQSGGTLTISAYESISIYSDGLKFIIQNDARTLDSQNEWYYNPTTKKIRIYSLSQPTNVKISTIDNLLTILTKNYIVIRDISFTGANMASLVMQQSNNITISNCSMSFSGEDAIMGGNNGTSQNIIVENCTVSDSNNGAIGLSTKFVGAIVRNNSVSNTGIIYGASSKIISNKNSAEVCYGISASGQGTLIEGNTVQNTGYVGIRFLGSNTVVQNNFVENFCQINHDGGGIYTWNGANVSYSGTKVLNNVVINNSNSSNIDSGIYLDDYTNGIELTGNSISTTDNGIYYHNSYNSTTSGNVVFDCNTGVRVYNNLADGTMHDNVIQNNKIVAKSASQYAFFADPADRMAKALSSNNNLWARPVSDNGIFKLFQRVPGWAAYYYSISEWSSYSGNDANSTKSPQSVSSESDLQFEYNATTSAKTIPLSRPMIDMKGTKYATSVTLQPYTSIVLMKDNNPDLSDNSAPVITSFSMPSNSTTLSVNISSFVASDNIGVTGYLLSESSAKPSATATGWTSAKPTSYLFASTGTKTLYAWAKDAAGNVSASFATNVTITLPLATTFTFTGPTSGNVYSASSNFTVAPNNAYTGTITITPSGTGSAGLSPKVLTFSNSSVSQSITFTPTVAGSIILTATNNSNLANPGSLSYTSNAIVPGAPGAVNAYAGNSTATVSFSAPVNNGGTSNLVYTVTSVPAGGIDIQAGSSSLTHTITGLANGTLYTFTVKATNIAGTSVASAPSNAVTPVAITTTEYKSICDGTSYNGWTVTGKYQRTLTTTTGGDSIVTTYLTVNPKYSVTEDIVINQGESYNGWTASGQYIRTLQSVSGCDSTVTTNLTVQVNSGKQGLILPTHFIPVWQGQSGYNLMTFVVNSATLEDLPLQADDEVGVFSNGVCVGSVRLTQPITSTDQTTYLSFAASQNTGSNNGYVLGDTVIFKIWDSSDQKECTVNRVIYQAGSEPVITSGLFAPLATAVASLQSYQVYTQTVNLKKGNNLFSTYLVPENADVTSVMASLCKSGALYKMQDEAGRSLEYWGSYGGWVNKIGDITSTEGYNVNVNFDCTLEITGRQKVALPLTIPLKKGWNFISFPSTEQVNAMTVVQSLINTRKLGKVQDELGNSIENIKGVGWVNNIGNFVPGKAYKVYANSTTSLTIQSSYTKSVVIPTSPLATEYFKPVFEGNGISHMNINFVDLMQLNVEAGDELAAFDGELCVGAMKLSANHIESGIAAMVASYSTKENSQDGFTEGNAMILYLWKQSSGERIELSDLQVIDGQNLFSRNASVLFGSQQALTGNDIALENSDLSVSVFPNPCSGNFSVRIKHGASWADGQIEILDITGKLIETRSAASDIEQFSLSNRPAGMYLVKTTSGSAQQINKLIVNN